APKRILGGAVPKGEGSAMFRRASVALAAAFLLVAQVAFAASTPPSLGDGQAALSAPITKALRDALTTGPQRFVVEFTAKADVKAAAKGKAKSHGERGAAVYAALAATANASQADALKIARATKGANARSYWLTNTMYVTGDAKLAKKLAAVKGV